jgi:hypothetical protein
LQLHSADEQKLKTLNGVCLYAYEFKPLAQSAQKISRQIQIESLPDIQRSTISREREREIFFCGPPPPPPIQGCQMVYFQTQNPNLGKLLRALHLKMSI